MKLKPLIQERINQVLNEESRQELLTMLKDYIEADFTADQGWGEYAREAEADLKRIEAEVTKLKGKDYFEHLKEFADLSTYDAEYAGAEDSKEIQKDLEVHAKALGFTVRELKGYDDL